MKKAVGILMMLCVMVLAISGSYTKGAGIVTKEVDLGWITPALSYNDVNVVVDIGANSSIAGGEFYLHNYWNFTLNCGAHLPINLSVEYPQEIVPGENITVNVSIDALPGFIFLNLTGIHKLNVTLDFNVSQATVGQQIDMSILMMLLLEVVHKLWQIIELETPIGTKNITATPQLNNTVLFDLYHILKTQISRPISHSINREGTIENAINTYVSFDVNVVTNTKIIGHIVATGTALSHTVNKTIEWTDEGEKAIEIPISPDASPMDSLQLNIELEYVVEEFYIEFSNITLVGDIDKEKIGAKINDIISGEIEDYQGIDFGIIAKQAVETVLGEYYNGHFPVNITSVGKSMPIADIETQAESNEVKSTSPYTGEETTLLSEAISISVSGSLWYARPELYIAIAVITGMIIAIYAMRRRNKEGE